MDINDLPDDAFLDDKEASDFLGMSVFDFKHLSILDKFPFSGCKIGKQDFYRMGNLRSYKASKVTRKRKIKLWESPIIGDTLIIDDPLNEHITIFPNEKQQIG